MSREYVDRGPYLCRYEARHGWVVYLNDAGDLKYLCETNAEAKAKDIVGIMNADVARFDAKMRVSAPATAVEEARKAFASSGSAWARHQFECPGAAFEGPGAEWFAENDALRIKAIHDHDALIAAEAAATHAAKESRSDDRPAAGQGGGRG